LAALQNSTGLNLSGSTGGAATEINQTNLQGLATLANLSVANPSMYPDLELQTLLLFIYSSHEVHGVSYLSTWFISETNKWILIEFCVVVCSNSVMQIKYAFLLIRTVCETKIKRFLRSGLLTGWSGWSRIHTP
jgi:hypothetical protein